MDNLEKKKLALIRILKILEKESDCDHPLKQSDIAALLEEEYGITLERKAVGRNIALLKDAGFEIESHRAGSFLEGRTFTEAELRILIEGLTSYVGSMTETVETITDSLGNEDRHPI